MYKKKNLYCYTLLLHFILIWIYTLNHIPARVLNINIYDHIIVAGDNYFSFRENKII
ncbi:MAG: hypothetical protein IPL16_12850 [Ignavibacteria bacterium]|nr:hypothetical protein [Ignavibacteria bacterium]